MIKKYALLKLCLTASFLTLSYFAIGVRADDIQRCILPDGSTLLTDRSCSSSNSKPEDYVRAASRLATPEAKVLCKNKNSKSEAFDVCKEMLLCESHELNHCAIYCSPSVQGKDLFPKSDLEFGLTSPACLTLNKLSRGRYWIEVLGSELNSYDKYTALKYKCLDRNGHETLEFHLAYCKQGIQQCSEVTTGKAANFDRTLDAIAAKNCDSFKN